MSFTSLNPYIDSYICSLVYTHPGCFANNESNSNSFKNKLSDDFYRIHRSYLVSLKHIVRISRTAVHTHNGIVLPLARGKYDDINRAFIDRN